MAKARRTGLWAATHGQSSIEFAVIAALFLVPVILGILDFGMLFFQQMQVANAAQAGADYVTGNPYSAANVTTAAQNATGLSGVTVTPTLMGSPSSCGCPASAGITGGQTCGAACPGGAGTATGYVEVQTSVNYHTIFPWPGLTNPVTLSATAYAICQNSTCS